LSAPPRRGEILAPFRIRAYRYQWPSDLATSWAFEMETLILGWYVLTETGSVLLLTLFASLQYVGTLISPLFGVAGDRVGQRALLCGMRLFYTLLAAAVMLLSFAALLSPYYVLCSAGLMGLVRPSDVGMRSALVGDTMPRELLLSAMSIQRTTQDSARITGALSGAGLVAALGIGPAYAVVTGFYATAVVLTLKAGPGPVRRAAGAMPPPARPSPWSDLKSGIVYVWRSPHLLGTMYLAFLLNLTAFPLMTGLLPYVAREVYHSDRTLLGYMVACAATGALAGSVLINRYGMRLRPGRMAIVFSAAWLVMLLLFAQMPHPAMGLPVLALAGCVQCLALVPMTTVLLRSSEERFRGRVMGIRMLAIYGNIPGLLASGPMITHLGYPATAAILCLFGLASMAVVVACWHRALWRADARVNQLV
jgi:predicted MFS family arabinose efflux permease